jgi:hypothetical protein
MSSLNKLAAVGLILAFLPIQNAMAWGQFDRPEHDVHWARQNPVVVHNVYVHHDVGGCVGCGVGVAAVAGLIGGAIIGAAVAGSAPPPPLVYETPPPVVIQAPPPVYIQAGPPIGSEVAVLPPGCGNMNVNGVQYYRCGGVWYQPFFGGGGVYYTVVPSP